MDPFIFCDPLSTVYLRFKTLSKIVTISLTPLHHVIGCWVDCVIGCRNLVRLALRLRMMGANR
ncbi:MAG: hypothetical protein AAF171_01305 [Cyanobacteria bacterium P01_A01_bin.116]